MIADREAGSRVGEERKVMVASLSSFLSAGFTLDWRACLCLAVEFSLRYLAGL